MNVKVVLVIDDGRDGWSETYYIIGSDPATVVKGKGIVLASKRSQFLATTVAIVEARGSNADADRDAVVVRLGALSNSEEGADIAGTGVLMRVEGSPGHHSSPIWRGAPDVWLTGRTNPSQGISPAWHQAASSFRLELKAAWYLRVIDKTVANPEKTVVLVTNVSNQIFRLVTATNHGLQPEDQFTWQGARGYDAPGIKVVNPKGRYKVLAINSVTSFDAVIPNISNAWVAKTSGRVRKVAYTLDKITDTNAVRVAIRKTGRGF